MNLFQYGPVRLQRTWVGVGVVGGAAVGLGGGILSATADSPTVENKFLMNPEYPHSQDARDLWWQKLQDWGNDPNYGAVSPDWNNIWNETQNRVKQYYEGGPLAPGVQDRVNSSLARRGMSENPAGDFLHAQIGAQEGKDLLSANEAQNVDQANLANQGRDTWLNSLSSFQSQKPAGQWSTTVDDPGAAQRGIGQAISQFGGAVGSASVSAGSNQAQMDWLKQLQGSSPSGFAPSISNSPGSLLNKDYAGAPLTF